MSTYGIDDALHRAPGTAFPFFGRGETETQGRDHEVTQATLATFQSLLEDARLKRQIDQSEMTPGTINDYANARNRLIDFVQRAIWPGEDE
jgi:hypothetical protein